MPFWGLPSVNRPTWIGRVRSSAKSVALAALIVFSGCDNDPNPAPLHRTRPDGSPWIVRYAGLTEDPRSFDPQYMYDSVTRRVMELVHDTLLEYHPMKTDPYELRPAMLEEMPKREISADGKVSYVCRLKEVARFHDDPCFPGGKGRAVRAEDVHYSFQRMLDRNVESPFLSVFSEVLVGMAELDRRVKDNNEVFDYAWRIPGFEIIDERTFRLHLTKPYPQLVYWLAMHATTPVAREAVVYYDGKTHDGKPRGNFHNFASVGTGPFRIVEYIPRQRVRVVRVEGYATTKFPTDGFPPEKAEWLQQLAGKPLPFVDEINLPIFRETIPVFILTRQGYLDAMSVNKDAFASMVNNGGLAKKYRDRGMKLELDVDPATFWISMNMEDPVIGKNDKLRKALSCAYDNKTYSQIFYSGVAPNAEQILPPGAIGYDPAWKNPWSYDLEKARRLLAEAGYPNGRDAQTGQQLELRIANVASGSEERQRSEFDQRCFEALGIKVKVDELTFARLMDKLYHSDFQLASGSGWSADYPDPENFYALFHSRNFPPNGSNHCRYSRPDFDAAFDRMSAMDDGPERLAIIRQMNQMIADDCPVIFGFVKAFYTAVQPWAPRTHHNMMLEGGMKYLVADPVMREQKRHEWNEKPYWPLALLGGLAIAGAGYAIHWNRRHDA